MLCKEEAAEKIIGTKLFNDRNILDNIKNHKIQ